MTTEELSGFLTKAKTLLFEKYKREVTVRITKDENSFLSLRVKFESYEGDKKLGTENIYEMFDVGDIIGILLNHKLANLFKEEAKLAGMKLRDFVITIFFNPIEVKTPTKIINLAQYL